MFEKSKLFANQKEKQTVTSIIVINITDVNMNLLQQKFDYIKSFLSYKVKIKKVQKN